MTKWMLGAIIILGTVLSLGLGLWGTPVGVTSQGQLFSVLDQACAKAEQLQSGSQVLCNQVKERLKEELQTQLQWHRSIKLDSDLLGETLAWVAQKTPKSQSGMGADQALQLALSLTEMLNKGAYGERLHELLAYGQAAGYTPAEITSLVTQLARMVTAQTPAGNVLDKALKHLNKAGPGKGPEKILEAVQQEVNNNPGMPDQEGSSFANNEEPPAIGHFPGPTDKGPAVSHQPPNDKSDEARGFPPNLTNEKQQAESGPTLGIQRPGDEGEDAEVSTPPNSDEEEDEGVPQHGRGHKPHGKGKKGHK